MYYKSFLKRFILRRGALRRARLNLAFYRRKLTKDIFKDLLSSFNGKIVTTLFDAGANIGFVTYQFQKAFPSAHVYAFEPNPAVFKTLKQSYQGDANVHVYNLGIGDQQGCLEFNLNANTGTSSFLLPTDYHRSHQARRLLEPIEVEMVTIDSFTKENSIENINVLKLDIEGYELNALRGAQHLLEDQAIDAIYTEVNIVPSYLGQPLFHEITAFLERYGYHLYNIDDFVAQESRARQAIVGNASYISMRHRKFMEEIHGISHCGW